MEGIGMSVHDTPAPDDDRVEDTGNVFDSPLTRGAALKLGAATGLGMALAGAAGAGSSGAATRPFDMQALVARARAEGTLTFYSAMPPIAITALVNGFKAQYPGIDVVAQRLTSVPQATLIDAEVRSGRHRGDLAQMSDEYFMAAAGRKGWYRTPPANLPGIQKWPVTRIRGGKNKNVYLQSLAAYTVGYNNQLVRGSDIPTDWRKLANAKFKGRVMTTDPRANNNVLSFFYMLRAKYGDALLRNIANNGLQLTTSSVVGMNLVASGDMAMLAPSNYWSDIDLINKGAPVSDAIPSPTPTTGAEMWFGMIKDSPHPNAALLFFNYALSTAGQLATCGAPQRLCQSVRGVKGSLPFPKEYVAPPINAAVKNRSTILRLLNLNA
jgi:iron(III) transport system substrate-binding protein